MEILPVFLDIKTQTHPVKFKTGILEIIPGPNLKVDNGCKS